MSSKRAQPPDPAEPPVRRDTTMQGFLDRYARAVSVGDGAKIATMWDVPALVVADAGVHAVSSAEEVAAFFRAGTEQYTARGIVETRAEIVRLSWPTDRIALVEVRWPYLDKHGTELGDETSTYTLRRDAKGALKICAAVMHGAGAGHVDDL